jgi:Ion channel
MPPAGSNRLFGTRMERLRTSHNYGFVLLMIVGAFVFAAVAPDADWSSSTLLLIECATLIIALWSAGLTTTDSKFTFALIALSATSAVALVVWGGSTATGLVALLSAALTIAIATAIIVGVVDQGEVNRQAVTGAVCIYVLLGFFFIYIYGAIAAFGHGPLFAQGTDGTRSIRLYFSYVTLATVGYGDYTMAGNLGRTLAVLEALMGQLYLVTVLALLVSRMRPKHSVDKT